MKKNSSLILLFILIIAPFSLLAQKGNANIDSSILSVTISTIQGKKYFAIFKTDGFYLTNSKEDILLKQGDYYIMAEFKDFNKDGYKDLLLYQSSNTPSVSDLFLFVPSTHKFKKVEGFDDFPAPEAIKGTRYFYSYHRSGCADLNWNSDLFYIDHFKTYRIGNIAGRECNDRDEKDNVYINKVRNKKEVRIKTIPIRAIYKYKDFKWGFIKEYWEKNYKTFL